MWVRGRACRECDSWKQPGVMESLDGWLAQQPARFTGEETVTLKLNGLPSQRHTSPEES